MLCTKRTPFFMNRNRVSPWKTSSYTMRQHLVLQDRAILRIDGFVLHKRRGLRKAATIFLMFDEFLWHGFCKGDVTKRYAWKGREL